MIDIAFLRANPDLVRENIKKKFQDKKIPLVDEAIALDSKKRALQTEGDNLRASRNALSKEIGILMREKKVKEAEEVKAKVNANAKRLEEVERESEEVAARLKDVMMRIPNIISIFSKSSTGSTSTARVARAVRAFII